MAEWIVAQVAPQLHERARKFIKFPSFYAMTRRTYGRPERTEVKALYPGYLFVRSGGEWYSLLACSAVWGIVSMASTLEPLTSEALDAHVEKLMARVDSDGYLPAPKVRSKFLRGDRVRVETPLFEGEGTFLRTRGSDSAEVSLDGSDISFTVYQRSLENLTTAALAAGSAQAA